MNLVSSSLFLGLKFGRGGSQYLWGMYPNLNKKKENPSQFPTQDLILFVMSLKGWRILLTSERIDVYVIVIYDIIQDDTCSQFSISKMQTDIRVLTFFIYFVTWHMWTNRNKQILFKAIGMWRIYWIESKRYILLWSWISDERRKKSTKIKCTLKEIGEYWQLVLARILITLGWTGCLHQIFLLR